VRCLLQPVIINHLRRVVRGIEPLAWIAMPHPRHGLASSNYEITNLPNYQFPTLPLLYPSQIGADFKRDHPKSSQFGAHFRRLTQFGAELPSFSDHPMSRSPRSFTALVLPFANWRNSTPGARHTLPYFLTALTRELVHLRRPCLLRPTA